MNNVLGENGEECYDWEETLYIIGSIAIANSQLTAQKMGWLERIFIGAWLLESIYNIYTENENNS